jgi:hypothetical protein
MSDKYMSDFATRLWTCLLLSGVFQIGMINKTKKASAYILWRASPHNVMALNGA